MDADFERNVGRFALAGPTPAGNGIHSNGETSAVPTAIGSPFSDRIRATPGRRWERIIGASPTALELEQTLRRAARAESTILITGETGCGKEEIARALHAQGQRATKPFVAINCGAMAATLIESQLFGHEKGSFTGAVGPSRGVFRAAHGGIVFLDEIGEMPLELQPRLLRVLQQREVTPVGSTDSSEVDVQVIAATNRDLAADVREGRFREDLYYRLNTIELAVPPLRDRATDIPLFVDHFRLFFARKFGVATWQPDAPTLARFLRYRWPGNVRQLSQVIERVYALGSPPDLPADADSPVSESPRPSASDTETLRPAVDQALPVVNLDELRRLAVRQALTMTDGHKGKAAQLLGVHLNTMTRLVEEALPEASQRRAGRRPVAPK
jgi:DNA-binding NtrC family response regulator